MQEDVKFLQGIIEKAIAFFQTYSLQVVAAVFIIIVGILLASWISNAVRKLCLGKKLDQTLSEFIAALVRIVIIVFAVIISLSKFGITITPFVAALGAGVFGATFAIQAPIANFASGLTLLLIRPFKIGDTVKILGKYGIVEHIQLGQTILVDEDGVRIFIPNKHIMGEIVANSKEFRILESSVGISYASDPSHVIGLVEKSLADIEELNNHRAPRVGIETFADSAIVIAWRCWVPSKAYHNLLFKTNQCVWDTLKANKIVIPFPQREVTIRNATSE